MCRETCKSADKLSSTLGDFPKLGSTIDGMSEIDSIISAKEAVVSFREERGWGPLHTPQHLAAALSIEAGELQEELLWKDDNEIKEYVNTERGREAVRDEIADVLIYALLFCERLGINPLEVIRAKLEKNAEKYPIDEKSQSE